MSVYLLTWNPEQFSWVDLPQEIARIAAGESITVRWSTGVRKTLPLGSRVFLVHLGKEPRGIVGSGVTVREPYEALHWDASKAAAGQIAWYTEFAPDLLLNPAQQAPLDPRQSPSASVRDFDWTPQSSGTQIPGNVAEAALEEWFAFVGERATSLGAADLELSAVEGVERTRLVKHRSRERALRNAKIAEARAVHDGRLVCEVPGCGFDFEAIYGDRGKDFAEVHHIVPLSTSGLVQTRLADLRVVCANCHRIIHRYSPMADVDTLIPMRGNP